MLVGLTLGTTATEVAMRVYVCWERSGEDLGRLWGGSWEDLGMISGEGLGCARVGNLVFSNMGRFQP